MCDRPQALNAMDRAMAVAFAAACRELAADTSVRVVVLAGAGKAFMAGGDLNALRGAPTQAVDALIPPLHEAIRLLAEMPKPVLASVHGAAAGAGMSLALAADLTLAAEGTKLAFAYSDIGTSCDGGMSWHLARRVGLNKALEIAFLGDGIDAAEALRLGLVNRVVPADRLADETAAWAQRLAEREPHALAHLKGLLRRALDQPLPAQLDDEYQAFRDCAARPEFPRAIDAFFARRRAQPGTTT
jgi:2-(1,2-epoxy-1,2-dihydrophenyl)acetyl-CoA isomerase